jgi:pimeloyl-ACP methyl ester carboxylesterase
LRGRAAIKASQDALDAHIGEGDMTLWKTLATGVALAAMTCGPGWAQADTSAVPASYAAASTANGATEVTVAARPDGGALIDGRLDGRQFAIAVPKDWNHQSLIFAHGYSTPDSSVDVSSDPVAKDPSLGLLPTAYGQGFAVGHTAFDKAGLGIESGARAMLRLQQLLQALGAKRSYVSGGSMGGNIVVTLIEQHPDVFTGGLSVCGVTSSFEEVVGGVIDRRALYNYYTRGTPYALPGEQDIARSAVPTRPPAGSTTTIAAFQIQQTLRLAAPIVKLFADAQREPEGAAASIIRKISSVTGAAPEPGSYLLPIVTAAMAMDDIRATAGGSIYSNRTRRYAGGALTAAETAALNKGVQRMDADAAALRYLRQWHTASGVFKTPLVAVHNQIDALVPYSQALDLEAKVAAHGDPKRLVLITVPPLRIPIPGTGVYGYAHCGFDAKQLADAWATLRRMTGS